MVFKNKVMFLSEESGHSGLAWSGANITHYLQVLFAFFD